MIIKILKCSICILKYGSLETDMGIIEHVDYLNMHIQTIQITIERNPQLQNISLWIIKYALNFKTHHQCTFYFF